MYKRQDHVGERLEVAGRLERVSAGVERVLGGTGASRQRAAYERTGSLEGVVDDVLARTVEALSPSPDASAGH